MRGAAKLLTAALAAALVVSAVPAAGAVSDEQVIGHPELSLSVQDNHFTATERAQLTVQIANDGSIQKGGLARFEKRVQTARNLRLEVQEGKIDGPIEVTTGPAVVGTLPSGVGGATFGLEIGDAEPGRYRIPVEVEYEHTRLVSYDRGGRNPEYGDVSRTETKHVAVVVEDRPQFELTTDGTRNLYAGDTGRLAVTIRNTGTTTATDATATVTSKTKGLFFGGFGNPSPATNVFVDELAPGETREVSVQVGASDDLAEGRYPAAVEVTYENRNGITEQSDSLTTAVAVGPERQFALRNVTTEHLQVGGSGATLTGTLVNTGESPARNTVLRLGSSGPVTATAPESAVGAMEPGERRQVRFTLSVKPNVEPGSRVLTFVPEFENADGEARTSTPLRQSVHVGNEITFDVEDVETGPLRVGESDVNVTGTVVNSGNATATNAVVKLQSGGALRVTGPESAVGDLEPGERRQVRFQVAVPEDGDPGSRSLTFGVEYENANGDLKTNLSPVRRSVDVGPERDTFRVVDVATNLSAGGSGTVRVTVEHTGEEPVTEANAKVFLNDPLSSSDNAAFLGSMEPGERKVAVFAVSANGDAIAKEYGASVEVRYEDGEGDSRLADGLSVGIPVGESGGGLPLPYIALGTGLVLLGGGLVVRRRGDN